MSSVGVLFCAVATGAGLTQSHHLSSCVIELPHLAGFRSGGGDDTEVASEAQCQPGTRRCCAWCTRWAMLTVLVVCSRMVEPLIAQVLRITFEARAWRLFPFACASLCVRVPVPVCVGVCVALW